MRYLALCCIAKDEDPFLKEWIAYHSLLGVEHFFIYDNESRRPIREVLDGFTDSSRVTIRREATMTGYKQLEVLLRARGKTELADNVLKISARYNESFS